MTAQSSFRGDDASLPMAEAGAHARRGLIALTDDQPLIRALQDLAATGTDVSVVPDLQSFTDEMLQHAGFVALIDAAALPASIGEVVDVIHGQLPDICLMVAGHSAEQQQLAARISSGTVFRFLHKPASTQRLKLFLDAAARPVERSIAVAPAPAVTKIAVVPATRAAGGKPSQRIVGIGIGIALVVAAAAAWALWPRDEQVADQPVAPSPTVQTGAAPLITQAAAAFATGRFVASDGSSAAELYRAALRIEPANATAKDGYSRSIDQALHKAEESLLAGRFNDAGNIAAAVQLIEPGNSRLGFLNTQIAREMARASADASQRQVLESRQAQVRAALTSSMKERLQSDALIDPAAPSAAAAFREAEALGANDPAVRSARETLVAAPPEPVVAPRVEVPAPAAPPLAAAAPAPQPEPVAPAAAVTAPAAPVNEIVAASKLKLVHREQAVYPDWALQQLISGWVEMDFTVAKDGSVKDVVVTSAQPRSTFNSAATKALARYRYEPVMKDGVAVTQRARIRLAFSAQDAK